MSEYRCLNCNRTLNPDQLKKRVRCIYCGYKIIFKTRSASSTVDAV